MSQLFKRLSSTINIKPLPSKTHLHRVLPDSSFPAGYALTGLHAGVKKKSGVLDLAIIISTSKHPTSAAACFTRNAFKAAPVVVSDEILSRNGGRARGLVVNSGCANAVTGRQGLEDAWAMVNETDKLLPHSTSSQSHNTLVMSTGVIGQRLPIQSIIKGIQSQASADSTLASDFAAWERAAKAFMTTDTFPKLRSRSFEIRGTKYRIAGMDKGAGMIHPNMGPASTLHATLLGCILTDAAISPPSLQNALTYAMDRSFNCISVDGEMSTNDTVLVLANGAAAPDQVEIDEVTDKEGFEIFKRELTAFAAELAQLVVRDGEGATKFVTVNVKGAPTYEDAHRIASRISTSALVKTALYGEDANWGRVLSATGSVPLSGLDPQKVSVSFLPSDGSAALPVLVNGEPENVDEGRAKEILSLEDFGICVELGAGMEEATYWTCDFSYEYVRINGDYRS
ncbi:Arginine biosynthesis bifunctional protein ArgJ, mitochondrial [Mycena indigotica]|uniref:Arginine biosynthesis bifunctional protein ArgJ, mitochondrial n=1 Tax=Mycena indigotica TaxID=2126181 RepID=A0A8H6WEP0_9AGAR|nr:Arginine biosynthesis bifunctional protein ArgJ, mitochondrial [Mycena indigotica]KAF7309669.1 Arginine biosynthesis bifunctional protein ArgJ, mitochondrial [Mycena indigotica]